VDRTCSYRDEGASIGACSDFDIRGEVCRRDAKPTDVDQILAAGRARGKIDDRGLTKTADELEDVIAVAAPQRIAPGAAPI